MPTFPDIRLLALDVDGVLTDGGIMLDDTGREIKRFCAADGVGLRAWSRLGLKVAIITGRRGDALLHRMADLGVSELIQGSSDKAESLRLVEHRTGITRQHIAYMGDDWPDLPILRRVAYPMAPANADRRIRDLARFVAPRRGGDGAVRDAIEHLLDGLGLLPKALGLYDPPDAQPPA
jgi:3-deoxy-D-manno-octulosonate 8-phosphate phosphatase (KDO 8-P phosphatase)